MKFIAAKCPNCDGELQVPDDRDFVKCMYCGVDIKVRDAVKVVFEGNIPNLLNLGNEALKVGNYKESYDYFSKVLEYDVKNSQAWFGKASTCAYLYKIYNINEAEVLSYFDKSISLIESENILELKSRISEEINLISKKLFSVCTDHKNENLQDEKKWTEYIKNSKKIIKLLEKALIYNPKNSDTLRFLVKIATENLYSVRFETSYKSGNRTVSYYKQHTLDSNSKNYLVEIADNYKQTLMSFDPIFKKQEEKKVLNKTSLKNNKKFIRIGTTTGLMSGLILGIIITILLPREISKDVGVGIILLTIVLGFGIGYFIADSKTKKLS